MNNKVFFFLFIVSLKPTSSLFFWIKPESMLGAATRSFINTEPGAPWEPPVCPLSTLATAMWVWSVWSPGQTGRSYFMGAWLSASSLWLCRMCPCACKCVNMCIFPSWRVCVSRGIRSQASPRGVRGPVTSKGRRARYASQLAKGKSCLCGGVSLGRTCG